MVHSPCFFSSPLLAPLCLPFASPSTYLAPSNCDRNRPPWSQVACKLTPFAPLFTQLSHPLQIPKTPTARRQTKTTSGIFRLLLSGTMITTSYVIQGSLNSVELLNSIGISVPVLNRGCSLILGSVEYSSY